MRRIAKSFVENMKIGRKPNPHIKKARRKFGKFIDEILKKKYISPSKLSKKEKEIVEKLKDPEYGPLLIEKDGKLYVKKEVGEAVRLVYSEKSEECKILARMVKEECWRRGAHVFDLTYSSEEARRCLQLIPFDTAAELPIVSKLLASNIDVRIFIGGEEDILWARGLEEKLKAGAKASQKLREIIDRKRVRWCYFGWPVKKPKEQMLLPYKRYREIFLKAIKATFSKKVRKLCEYYRKALEGADEVIVMAEDGTDLFFRIKGRPILVADGRLSEEDIKRGDVGLNIPDGEVFVAPLETSAEGYILFEKVFIPGFGRIRNLEIEFNKGKVVWFDSPDKKIFQRFLDANTGEKDRIAEFGIGTNPGASFVGETIVDEKIFGTIHIAIGNNRGAYHGKNVASSHLDMIKDMRKSKGKVFVDGELIMRNGLPAGKI